MSMVPILVAVKSLQEVTGIKADSITARRRYIHIINQRHIPVEDTDQIMITSDGGQLIRMGVGDIRIASRSTQGVTLFDLGDKEKVVSVAHVAETEQDEDGDEE